MQVIDELADLSNNASRYLNKYSINKLSIRNRHYYFFIK